MYGPIPPSAPPSSFLAAAAAALSTFRAKVAALRRSRCRPAPYRGPFYEATEAAQIAIFYEDDRATWGIEIALDRDHLPSGATIYATIGKTRNPLRTLGSFTFDVHLTATEADIRATYNARIQHQIAALSALLLPEK